MSKSRVLGNGTRPGSSSKKTFNPAKTLEEIVRKALEKTNAAPADGISSETSYAVAEAEKNATPGFAEPLGTETAPVATEPEEGSYAWLADQQKKAVEEQAAADTAYAEKLRADSISDAERAREESEQLARDELSRRNVQANDDYERARLTYGAAAESLAQAGLTGSGYSDNLTRDAYAQRGAAMNAANLTYGAMMQDSANKYNEAVDSAELKYGEALHGIESQKRESELELAEDRYTYGQQLQKRYDQDLLNVKNGLYTPKEIEEIGRSRGYSDEQIATLTEAATAYHAGTTNSDFKTAVESGSFDHAAIDAALADGSITKDQYDDMQATFRDQLDTDVNAFHTMDAAGNVVGMSRKDAEAMVKEYERHPWISDEQKKAIRKSFEELYCVKSFSATVNNGLPDGDPGSGDNFSVKVNGEKYRVQIGEKMSATSNVAIASSDVEDDEVFFYDGGLYVKHNGSVFSIEKRPWSNGSQAEELFDLAMNS